MSITVHDEFVQGSLEWFEQRRGILTASTIGQLITAKTLRPAVNDHSRALVQTLVAERITVRAERGEVLVRMEATGDEMTLSRESALGLASELADAAKDALGQHIIASYRQSVKP